MAASCIAACFLQMPSTCLCTSMQFLLLKGCDSPGRCGSYGLYCVFDGHNGVACAQHSHDLLIEVRSAVCTALFFIICRQNCSELCRRKNVVDVKVVLYTACPLAYICLAVPYCLCVCSTVA